MQIGICKLCQKSKELCKKSHIVSKHVYKPLRDKDNSLVYFDGSSKKQWKNFSGEFEGGILCEDCDNRILGEVERYAARFIFNNKTEGSDRKEYVNKNGVIILKLGGSGYDYVRIKLFLLSLLWRASISSRPFFKEVKLEKSTEEEIRKMILCGDAGSIHDYPCLIILPAQMHNGKAFSFIDVGTIRSPLKGVKDGMRVFNFILNGCDYWFFITKDPKKVSFCSVQKDAIIFPFRSEQETKERWQRMSEIINA